MKPGIDSVWWKLESSILPGIFILQALFSIWMIFDGWSNYQDAADFGDNAILGVGIITKTVARQSHIVSNYTAFPGRTDYISTVQFKTQEGKTIELDAADLCKHNSIDSCDGTKVQILYAADNPQLSMVESGVNPLVRVKEQIKYGVILLLLSSAIVLIITRENRND
jgi:hypothetical protein